ncbi:hypothetical protein DPMN_092550, partial [Dreissena polymorpha]
MWTWMIETDHVVISDVQKRVKDGVPLNTGKKIDMKEDKSTQRESSDSESDTEFNRETIIQPQASTVSTEIEEQAVREEVEENIENYEEEETETLEEDRDS